MPISDLTGLDETKPDGSVIPVSQLDDYERETRAALKAWVGVEHDLQGHHALQGVTVGLTGSGTVNNPLYVDLDAPASAGPLVTLTVGSSGKVVVGFSCGLMAGVADEAVVGFEVFGASTRSVQNIEAISSDSTTPIQVGTMVLVTGLTPGLTSFSLLYRTGGVAAATFYNRRIFAVAI